MLVLICKDMIPDSDMGEIQYANVSEGTQFK
jgi:hypothetical protein